MDFWGMIPPGMAQAIRNDDAAQENKRKLADLERTDRAWATAQMNQAAENNFVYTTGHSSAEYREAMSRIALAKESRDPAAEYGSARRSAVLIDGRELKPREMATGPMTMRPDSITAQLNRARQQPGREFMRRMVADLDARRGGRNMHPASISRSSTAGHRPDCLDCQEVGATPAESFLLHSDPDLPPLPVRTVPDHPPQQRSKRARAGTGWPEISR